MRIALAQINAVVGGLEENRDAVIRVMDCARKLGTDLIAFPELVLTGYPPEDLLLKDHFVTNNLKTLKDVAKAAKGIAAVVGFVDRDKVGIYNAAAILSSGKIAGVYRKKHLPNYSVFDEKRYFVPGSATPVFRLGDVCFGVNICEDIWVHDGPQKAQAQAGAGLIVNISSSPYETGKRTERLKLLQRRAKETGAVIAYVNLAGGQDELVFDGASMIVSPSGKLLASGMQFERDMIVWDIEVPKRKALRAVVVPAGGKEAVVRPALEKQLPVPLEPVAEMYAALVLGTRDYIQKNGFKKVLIGLSGGIDSALVAAIACDAVGAENVVGISMPTRFNAEGTKSDARQLAANLGILFYEIPIESIVGSFLEALKPYFNDTPFGLAEENLQSRVRGNLLMAFSNKFGWLVLTTGNKSEMATGYCTLYGDMSGGYAVIKDILKTRVYEISAYVNQKAGRALIPETIFTRAPSAELRENQTDQDSLPPYDVLDALLTAYVEEHRSFGEMARTLPDGEVARRVIGLVDRSEYKRRQAPPGVKISKRAFGKDWRLPLTNRYKMF